MPARLVQVTIINNSDYPIVWQDDGREHGFWQEPWYPSNIQNLKKGERSSFRLESGGVLTGVKGWALFKIDIPFASNVGVRTEFFRLDFERAYIELEHFKGHITPSLQDPRTNDAPHTGPKLTYWRNIGSGDLSGFDSSPFEVVVAIPGAPLNAPVFLINESMAKHVQWVVEVRNTEPASVLPLQIPTKGIIYAVTPRVEAAVHVGGGSNPASGGELMWFRHDGRLDGSFKWEGPEKIGTRWDAFSHVFSDGEGIVYGVTPRVEATPSDHLGGERIPASGGDLMWYRHVGREGGSFAWQGPTTVGIRWDLFKHVFSGGDGIVYGIQDDGDLIWYRHVGRGDGSFVWEGPKKVGTGWGQLTQVFSGGQGVIYGVTPRVEATTTSDHPGGSWTPASGGDLMWFRHVGRDEGSFDWNGPKKVGTRWDAFTHVFSGGDGIIYGVEPRVEATGSDHVGGDRTWASGGDLIWDGPKKVGTGWGELTQVLSGGASLS
jgi:Tachylectin